MKVDAHRITNRLYIGGTPPDELKEHGFDIVVLCARELQNLHPDIHTLRVPLDDTETRPMTRGELRLATQAAQSIHTLRQAGARVLVTCAAGVNRSSFVAALSLIHSGWTAPGAIERIRERRHPPIGMMPLSNREFVRVLLAVGGRPRAVSPRGQA